MHKRTALVFGGSRGIGAACVDALTDEGFEVAHTYVSAPSPEGTSVRAYRADVCEADAVARVFDSFASDFGRSPDCIVANAGINVPPQPIADFDPENFRRLIEVNLVGAFNILREAAKKVADGGSIIALSTSMVRISAPGIGPYSATKAAVECLVRSLSKELAPRRVRVNAVAPGPVDTDLFRAGKDEAALQRSAALSPFNRVGKPQEIAEVVRFLASDRASWIHGQFVQPNGGMV